MATQKKYVCAFCARAFTRAEHKQRHERSHTNEKPFHCLHCTSAFVRRDLLQRHCRTVHNIFLSSNNFPTPKSSKVHTINNEKAEVVSNNNNELINILSISKKLYGLLKAYDADIEKYTETEINEFFLIGYIKLNSSESFPVLKSLLRNLVNYLNYFLNSDLNEFNVCLIYSCLSVGYAMNDRNDVAMDFFHKSWNLLIMKLIPNNNSNLINQIDILNNLFLHSYVFLNFNYDRFEEIHNTKGATKVNSELILNYLNDISFIILSNLMQNEEDQDSILLNKNMKMFWSTYILLSNYFIYKMPPKFYKLFLDKEVNDNKDLKTIVSDLSKSIVLIESDFLKEVIICTLANELNYLINFNKLLVCESKNALHNSIILINKSIINLSPNNPIFDIMKKKLVVNSPAKFNDLLNYYLFVPAQTYDWNLLIISLKEFNYNLTCNVNFNFNNFISNNMNTDHMTFANNLLPLFNSMSNDINNNLGIVGFPLIFNSQFLNKSFGLFDFGSMSNINKPSLNLLVIEAYLTISKILINLYKNESMANNYILQCLLYLLNGHNLNFRINDMNWYPELFRKLETIFNSWLQFINNDPNYMLEFRANLSNFLNNYINSTFVDEKSLSNKVSVISGLSSSPSTTSVSNMSPLGGPLSSTSSMQSGLTNTLGRMRMGAVSDPATGSSGSIPMSTNTFQGAFSTNFTTAPPPNPGGSATADGAPKGMKDLMLPPILSPLNLNKRNLKPMVPNLQ